MLSNHLRKIFPVVLILLALTVGGCIDLGSLGPIPVGICGLIVVILDIIAIVNIVGSNRTLLSKLVWILMIIFMPIMGLIIYYLIGK